MIGLIPEPIVLGPVTGPSHSVAVFRPGTSTARWSNQVSSAVVPVLRIGWNVDDRAGKNRHRTVPRFLVPAASGNPDKHLPASVRRFVHMPVIPAAGLERHVRNGHLLARFRGEIAELVASCGLFLVFLCHNVMLR